VKPDGRSYFAWSMHSFIMPQCGIWQDCLFLSNCLQIRDIDFIILNSAFYENMYVVYGFNTERIHKLRGL
jgi:hypothetical protein